jgi:hypothetical protein
MEARFPVTPSETSTLGAWLQDRLQPSDQVTSLVPEGFEAYVRLFHPAKLIDVSGHTIKTVRWREVANATGRISHRRMQWANIARPTSPRHPASEVAVLEAPDEGTLPLELARPLLETLQRFTPAQTHCGYALWEGYNCVTGMPTIAKLKAGRNYFLFEGQLVGLGTSLCVGTWQSANLVWPEDRTWCLASDVDLMSSYLGGSQTVVNALLANPALEACPIYPTDKITFDSDTVNKP